MGGMNCSSCGWTLLPQHPSSTGLYCPNGRCALKHPTILTTKLVVDGAKQ